MLFVTPGNFHLDSLPIYIGALLFFSALFGMIWRKRYAPRYWAMLVPLFAAPSDFGPSFRLFFYATDSTKTKSWPRELQGYQEYLALTAVLWFLATLFGIGSALVTVWKKRR